jgi:hypothetical protein
MIDSPHISLFVLIVVNQTVIGEWSKFVEQTVVHGAKCCAGGVWRFAFKWNDE